ncbi:hypothetical protein [Legionella clemsonensis]|uniref:Uncharacterized protein n=1 Tax=Legionella clemsonensis TaxID=1867846 RepID=A0A222P3C2_9GAMM|nr:hypothetical protein [Legionella clemsonensis]ASQ46331.1 hypothetical protein clem_08900 [Legionella clemsonensis]
MPLLENVIYSQEAIKLWSEELPHLESRIAEEEQVIKSEKLQLTRLNEQLNHLKSQIANLQTLISIQEDLQHHHHHSPFPHHHHHTFNTVVTVNVDTISSLITLRTDLANLRLNKNRLLDDLASHKQQITRSRKEIAQAEARISWIKNHTVKAQHFLKILRENPVTLVQSLQEKILKKFFDYEYNHPAGLSPRVRICLLAIHAKLEQLCTPAVNPSRLYPDLEANSSQSVQISYLRLCGFIWEMYWQVKHEERNEEFTNLLIELINELHIDEDGDLPDDLRSGKTADAHFQEIKNEGGFLADLTNPALLMLESTIVKQKLHTLRNYLTPQNSVHASMAYALQLIEDEIALKKEENETIDYHFYTAVMDDFLRILNPQTHHEAVKYLGKLAEYASGTPSLGKKIGGALLMVAGLAILTASIVGLAATFGGSSFFSACGIALGLSLLQFEVAFGSLFAISAVAGCGLTFFGNQTFNQGKRQGLSQELVTIQEQCQESYTMN